MKNHPLSFALLNNAAAAQRAHALRPLVLALCLSGCGLTVSAQTTETTKTVDSSKATSTENLRTLRERTRESIEAVRADQPGALDNARGLGANLNPTQMNQRASVWQGRAQAASAESASGKPPAPASTPEGLRYLETIQWPEPRQARGSKRLLPRPAALGTEEMPRMAYTPDFSRQRLTLGVVAGRVLIDLPQQELSDLNPQTEVVRVEVNSDDALSLPDLVNVGLGYSPVMDQAVAQLDAAINRSKQARADLLPRLTVRYSEGPENSKGPNVQPNGANKHVTYSESVRLTQPLFNLPLVSDWMTELSNERSANWRLQAAQESVALAVTQATLNLAAARLVLEHSDEQLVNFSRLLDYVQSRAQTGVASTADLERTRSRVLLARQLRIDQQGNYKNALLELQRLTGQSPTALKLPYLNQLPGLPSTQGEMRRMVWNQSFELRALRSDIEAQKLSLASNQYRMLPVVGISLEHDASRNVRGDNPRQVDQRLMGVMSWDVSLGGKEVYGISAAAAELDNRQAKLTEQGERVMQLVDADFAALQSATLRVTAGQAEQLATAVVVSSVNEQLRIGRIGSLLEALDAYERNFAARQRLTQTLAQQMQAQAQLLARMGLLSDLRDGAQAEMAPRSATSPVADPASPAVPQVPAAPAVPALPSVLVTPLPN
ncbi:TolC family protein [Limnohabitans sp.]|jgi:adhesin transport system outer membrane protein|uniref:TolC family protein n=1 Tax=Limnohabitans sp. TaxID=1907725 RepID=UPI0037C01BCE